MLVVAAFLGLGWWQVSRARDGNALSFGYAIEWPAFAAFVIYVWIKEMRRVVRATATDQPGPVAVSDDPPAARATRAPRARAVRVGPAYDDSDDAELAAYNQYLAWRAANPRASISDYQG